MEIHHSEDFAKSAKTDEQEQAISPDARWTYLDD
jgi:hypothetical protein